MRASDVIAQSVNHCVNNTLKSFAGKVFGECFIIDVPVIANEQKKTMERMAQLWLHGDGISIMSVD